MPRSCNPYEQHGVLLVNPSVPSENRWQPISSNPACQPEDLITPLANPLADPAALAYLTNKTIVVFGDSVDRGNVQNLCSFIPGSDLQLIGYNHRLSPPYPIGQEQGPEGFSNPVDGTRNWTTSEAARSFLCTVPSLGLRVLTLFHYGFREDDAWMRAQTHYFPPGKLEGTLLPCARRADGQIVSTTSLAASSTACPPRTASPPSPISSRSPPAFGNSGVA